MFMNVVIFAGFLTVAALAIFGAMIIWSLGVAAVATGSYFRWKLAVCRTHKLRIYWSRVPGGLLRRWIDFVPYKKGRITIHGPEGSWRGIGDWTVIPPSSNSN